jgi:AraC-like DNA-binding protein
MTGTGRTQDDASGLVRSLSNRSGVGIAAHVRQGQRLEILRARVELSALILVDRGVKAVKADGRTVRARHGQAIVLSGNQTVDFTNSVVEGRDYEARWMLFDNSLIDDPDYAKRAAAIASSSRPLPVVRLLEHVPSTLATAFEAATQALAAQATIPDAIARLRLLEVMHWLLEVGVVLQRADVDPTTAVRVRSQLAGRLDLDWTADRMAGELAMSSATLRRRLAAEGTTFADLVVDARMSSALTLLQATSQSVGGIALLVGYDSASRFAIRFRQRFGFAPSAVRQRERAR